MVRMFTITTTKDLRKVIDMLLNVCKGIAANVFGLGEVAEPDAQ